MPDSTNTPNSDQDNENVGEQNIRDSLNRRQFTSSNEVEYKLQNYVREYSQVTLQLQEQARQVQQFRQGFQDQLRDQRLAQDRQVQSIFSGGSLLGQAVTGSFSSSRPNQANIPRQVVNLSEAREQERISLEQDIMIRSGQIIEVNNIGDTVSWRTETIEVPMRSSTTIDVPMPRRRSRRTRAVSQQMPELTFENDGI